MEPVSPARRIRPLEELEGGRVGVVPVRCFTCGGLVGDKWEEFRRRVKGGEEAGKVLDDLGVRRYCCRSMLMTHVDIIDEILRYEDVRVAQAREKKGEKL